MRRSDALARGLAAIASGLLFAGAQPGFGFWPLAFLCFVPLLWSWRGAPLRMRLGLAWLSGTIGTSVATLGAGTAGASAYFGLGGLASLGVALALGQLFGAASFVVVALFAGDPLARGGGGRGLRFAAVFAGAELLRATLFTGFPWLLLGYAMLPAPELAGAAAYGGASLVSLLLAWANAELAAVVLAPGRRTRAALAAAFACLTLAAPGLLADAAHEGGVLVTRDGEAAAGAVRVLLVQPGGQEFGASVRGSAEAAAALTQQTSGAPGFDVAVWPENAFSALLPANAHLARPALAQRPAAFLILGAPRADPARPGSIFNSAVLLDATGRTLAHHDKVHLLPFAEYAPGVLPMRWFGAIEVTPGARPQLLTLGSGSFGPLICYEVLFSELAREQTRAGAGILLNLSNDSWFGRTGATEQHLAAAMFRALENARPVLRSTRTGITAAIDARGRVISRLPMDAPGILRVDVVPGTGSTPALLWGAAPVWLAFGLAVLLPAARRIRSLRSAEQYAAVEARRRTDA